MTMIDTAVQKSLPLGRKFEKYEFHHKFGGGDYHYNVYVRAYSKARREQEATEAKTFAPLTEMLKAQTQELKIEYIAQTRIWADKEFTRLGRVTKPRYEAYSDEKGRFNSYSDRGREFYAHERAYNSARATLARGKEEFTQRAVTAAEQHYEASIEKLAMRIEKKGLNKANLTVHSARLNQNFECTITDGVQSVRAFTILAWGQIVRPHYRFLVH